MTYVPVISHVYVPGRPPPIDGDEIRPECYQRKLGRLGIHTFRRVAPRKRWMAPWLAVTSRDTLTPGYRQSNFIESDSVGANLPRTVRLEIGRPESTVNVRVDVEIWRGMRTTRNGSVCLPQNIGNGLVRQIERVIRVQPHTTERESLSVNRRSIGQDLGSIYDRLFNCG